LLLRYVAVWLPLVGWLLIDPLFYVYVVTLFDFTPHVVTLRLRLLRLLTHGYLRCYLPARLRLHFTICTFTVGCLRLVRWIYVYLVLLVTLLHVCWIGTFVVDLRSLLVTFVVRCCWLLLLRLLRCCVYTLLLRLLYIYGWLFPLWFTFGWLRLPLLFGWIRLVWLLRLILLHVCAFTLPRLRCCYPFGCSCYTHVTLRYTFG